MPKERYALPTLRWEERLHYRDRLRAARYAALADAEGFGEICFAIESIGLRLQGEEAAVGSYLKWIGTLAVDSPVLSELPQELPAFFTRFEALYQTVRRARNDAMHTGVYARYATTAAIELCIGLEEALMKAQQLPRQIVADFMVKSPVIVEPWQPVAHARQLMLMHSFSSLPVRIGDSWKLVPELSMAKYLHRSPNRKALLATTIERAANAGLDLLDAVVVAPTARLADLLDKAKTQDGPVLWLVSDERGGLSGVLSPFELM